VGEIIQILGPHNQYEIEPYGHKEDDNNEKNPKDPTIHDIEYIFKVNGFLVYPEIMISK
jgi:hypothetical protein